MPENCGCRLVDMADRPTWYISRSIVHRRVRDGGCYVPTAGGLRALSEGGYSEWVAPPSGDELRRQALAVMGPHED